MADRAPSSLPGNRSNARWPLAAVLIAFAIFLIFASFRVVHYQSRPGDESEPSPRLSRLDLLLPRLLPWMYRDPLAAAVLQAARRSMRPPIVAGRGDWGVYYRAGLAMRRRDALYTLDYGSMLTFKNAPVVALALAPLSLLPVGLARWIWLIGDVLCLAGAYGLAARVIFAPMSADSEITGRQHDFFAPTPSPATRRLLIGCALLLTAHYLLDQIFSGATTSYFLLLTVAAFVWAWEGKPIRAGAALAAAILLKIVPLAFVPWLLLNRRPARAVTALVASLLVGLALPAAWIGPTRNLQLLRQWPAHLASTESAEQNQRPQNQSVLALLSRTLQDGPRRLNVADLSTPVVRDIWLGLSFITAAALYAWIGRNVWRNTADAGKILSLLLLYMTLFNPLAWRYNYVALGVPCLYVLEQLRRRRARPPLAIAALAAISYGLHFLPIGPQAYSARLWGGFSLAMAVLLSGRDGEPIADDVPGNRAANNRIENAEKSTAHGTP